MADETVAYRVSFLDGSDAHTHRVPLRAPFTKTLRRHFETVRELADGRKKLEHEIREIEHPMDVESEMRADAIRAWNQNRGSAIAAKNLKVEAVADPVHVPEAHHETRRSRQLPAPKVDLPA